MLSVQLRFGSENMMDKAKKEEIESSLPQNDITEQIQEAYENCLKLGDGEYFQELIELIDSKFVKIIRDSLWKKNRYSHEELEDIRQEAQLQVWKEIEKARENPEHHRNTFYWYARGIYKTCMNHANSEYFADKNFYNREPESISNLPLEEEFIGVTPLVENNPIEDDAVLVEERGLFYASFLEVYIRTLMNSEQKVPDCLAVMYMRVLPHVCDLVRDSIMSSVKWARHQIGDKDIGQITILSETQMRENGYPYYFWGEKYLVQLDGITNINGIPALLRNVKYLETYDKGRDLEHMDRDTHKIIQREAYKSLIKDAKYRSLAMEYVDIGDRMHKLIGGVK